MHSKWVSSVLQITLSSLQNNYFVRFFGPYKNFTIQTVSRWFKEACSGIRDHERIDSAFKAGRANNARSQWCVVSRRTERREITQNWETRSSFTSPITDMLIVINVGSHHRWSFPTRRFIDRDHRTIVVVVDFGQGLVIHGSVSSCHSISTPVC